MAFDLNDPRTQLTPPSAPVARPAGANRAPEYVEFGRRSPQEFTGGGSRSWWVRSQTCVGNYIEAAVGDAFTRTDHTDEYVVLVPSGSMAVEVSARGERRAVQGPAVVIVPPGDSSLRADAAGVLIRLFTARSAGLRARCANDDAYAVADPNVAPYRPWPDPPRGHRIRAYPLADVPDDPARFGRIFRCSTIMVNVFRPDTGPRDPSRLSPHHHDDFEQLSLQLAGDYVHHIRTPWTVDLAQWREDEHRHCASPALTVIPPPSIHTSQAVGDGEHQLVDIFCPPRLDFSLRPGWVLNADEYPLPS
jgi:hypothetical protein